jgi:nicotinic acid mononucleotide adenylyltransferase
MKKAVIAWGRMNPVTSGHEKLVNKVVSVAKRERAEPRIYLSHTQSAKKDPLQYKDKIAMAKKAFGPVMKQSASRTLIQLMQELEKAGFTEITMVAGSDRVREYDTLLNKYNGKDYNFDKIKVVSAGERDPDAEGAAGMSATKLRKAAADGDEKTFMTGVPSKMSSADAKKLYRLVRKGLLVEEINRLDKEELELFTDEELEEFVNEIEDWEELDEEYLEERAPLTLQQRIKKARVMKRLAPKLKRQREIKKFRMAPTERLVQRARKLARNLLRKKMAGKRGEKYQSLSPSAKIQVDTLIQKKASSVERIAKRLLPMVRKKEIERIRSARTAKKESLERLDTQFEVLSEKIKTPQDPDIADRKGTQPKRYHSGLAKSTKAARDAHFKKGAKMDDDNPAAYKPAPGDKSAETKP